MSESLIFSQLLINEEYARKVIPHLVEDYFSSEAEKNFFKIYSHFFKKFNKIPSKQALLIEIEKLKSSADVYTSLKEIVTRQEEFTESLPYLIETTESYVREKALFNALKESIIIADGGHKTKTADAIPAILQKALGICFDTTVGHNYFDESDARYDYYHQVEARIPSGIAEFDKITKGGFPRKTLNLFLAPPHGGKTLVMSNIGIGAVMAGYNVLTITMEMSEMEFSKRYDVQFLDVDFDTLSILPKNTFDSKFAKAASASRGKMVVREFPTGAAHTGHFRALLEELKTKQNFVPDMIIIDYLGICSSENYKASSGANSYTIVKAIGEELRALAITSNTAIISAIQTNRSGVGNSGIDMTNMADSLGSAMTADWILAIMVTDELKELHQLFFKQIKNRYAGIDDDEKFLLGVDYHRMKLFSLEDSRVPDMKDSRKKPKIETANDTFTAPGIDMLHQIKPSSGAFSDFNF